MSETSRGLDTSANLSKSEPDNFTFYAHQVKELLSHEEDFLPFSTEFSGNGSRDSGGKDMVENSSNGSLFSNSVGFGLSDYKVERLKALLRQAVTDLTPEVDEMLESVTKMGQLKSEVKSKRFVSENAVAEGNSKQIPNKKLKTSSSSSSISNTALASPDSSGSCREGDDDMQFLLENDSSVVEEAIKKHSDNLLSTLGHMEKQLEELLDTVVSTCRPMKKYEKRELQKLIKKLPPKNLDRVAEIVQHGKPAGMENKDEIFVDLEKVDNVTLHRLYFYVEAVEKARELCSKS